MTSKECLEHICKNCDNECCPYIHYEKSRCAFYGIIKQDLDRLEKLEKENQELKERYKHRAETSNDLCKEVKHYEKVIEIFREICSLNNNNKTLETERCILRLTEEEYELLKEVLEK